VWKFKTGGLEALGKKKGTRNGVSWNLEEKERGAGKPMEEKH